MLAQAELKNVITLMEIGAKALSQDKSLTESSAIQSTALALIQKLIELNSAIEPKVE